MNSNQDSQNMEEFTEEIEADNSLSIDDFIKELEAKEKDLHISSELVIEVEESDFDDINIAESLMAEIPVVKKPPKPATAKSSAPNPAEVIKLKNEISNLQNQISRFETERVELFELARRRQTDFDNYKNRTERERSETFRNQLGNLAQQMLPVLDNMNRALSSTTNFSEGKTQDFQQFFEGIVLVNQQMNEVLAEMGVQPIISVGEIFDPHLHEAVAAEETNEFPPHTVTAEFLRGYRIDEKVIRPAMVKVSTSDSKSDK
ncbi:MAG: nucleotide exchange factor GrpE [Pyrinomonadaceae bacterium]